MILIAARNERKKKKGGKEEKRKNGHRLVKQASLQFIEFRSNTSGHLGQVNLFGEGRGHTWVLFER